jgi:hypothetical protein
MDRDIIAERLRALASDDKKRSKAARFRDVIDDVEIALAAGVPRSEIIEELSKHGLEMTLATFATTLKRVREKSKKTTADHNTKPTHKPTQKTAVIAQQVTPVVELENPVESSNNPADIDKIIGSKPDLESLAKIGKRTKR